MHESKEVLDDFTLEVKKIEEKAEEILQQAQADKSDLINDAKTDSVKYISKKQKELETKKEDIVQKEKDKIDAKKAESLKKSKVDLKEFEKTTRKNLSKATDLILKKLDKTIEES
ncbi:hypothetical protein HN451_11145 [archaeon]|jgi:vacuolar-type H+-ATPase subunit H|nr:hypothetical protein [archaeon]